MKRVMQISNPNIIPTKDQSNRLISTNKGSNFPEVEIEGGKISLNTLQSNQSIRTIKNINQAWSIRIGNEYISRDWNVFNPAELYMPRMLFRI